MNSEYEHSDEKGFGYEIFIALVSVLSVFNLALVLIPGIDPDAVQVVEILNLFLTILFIFDFVYRITTATSKSYYFIRDFGWADLLACSPLLRFLRLFRVFKAYRLIHKHGTKEISDYLSNHRAESALYILVFFVIIILEVGSFLILSAESRAPTANITTAGDALWWAYVTITTVGYGDKYPVTSAGRLVGVLVMTTGVGIFATFAGYISNKLLTTPDKEKEKKPEEKYPDFEDQIISKIDELKSLMVRQERKNNEISVKIEKLEKILATGKPALSSTAEEKPPEGPQPGEKYLKEDKSRTDYKSSFWKNTPKK